MSCWSSSYTSTNDSICFPQSDMFKLLALLNFLLSETNFSAVVVKEWEKRFRYQPTLWTSWNHLEVCLRPGFCSKLDTKDRKSKNKNESNWLWWHFFIKAGYSERLPHERVTVGTFSHFRFFLVKYETWTHDPGPGFSSISSWCIPQQLCTLSDPLPVSGLVTE